MKKLSTVDHFVCFLKVCIDLFLKCFSVTLKTNPKQETLSVKESLNTVSGLSIMLGNTKQTSLQNCFILFFCFHRWFLELRKLRFKKPLNKDVCLTSYIK